MNETWKPVVGFDGIYSVSSSGRVRRDKPENNTFAGRILKPDFPAGYEQYSLYRNGIKFRFKAHQLVAAAFIGPCPEGQEVNHLDGNKRNNYYTNLEYLTPLDNHRHASRIGLKPFGERNGLAKLTDDAVRFIRTNHRAYHPEFSTLALSKKFGVHKATIGSVLNGRTWTRTGAHR